MKIIQVFLNNSLRNFNYILYSEITKEAIFFDPTDISQGLAQCREEGITPKYLMNTHGHCDHVADNKKFLEIKDTKSISLEDGDEFIMSPEEKIICRFTPGHVKNHYCYFLYEGERLTGVISGDILFNAGVGNCKDGGDPGLLYETIRDIFLPLSDDVLIYPSHDYFLNNLHFAKQFDKSNENIDQYIRKIEGLVDTDRFILTTMGEEKLFNPFLRAFEKLFLKNWKEREQLSCTHRELFISLRKKRDTW